MKVCILGIEGMTCHSCVSLIESTVGEMKGVVKVTVSLAERQGTVEYDSALVTPEEIRNTVKDMGFIVAGVTGIAICMYFQFSIPCLQFDACLSMVVSSQATFIIRFA